MSEEKQEIPEKFRKDPAVRGFLEGDRFVDDSDDIEIQEPK